MIIRRFYALFIVITSLGISTSSRTNRIRKFFMMCTCPTDFAEVFISLKAPRGLPIHRLEVNDRFFGHWNINKTNRIKENDIFLKNFFCHGVDLFRNYLLNNSKTVLIFLKVPKSTFLFYIWLYVLYLTHLSFLFRCLLWSFAE